MVFVTRSRALVVVVVVVGFLVRHPLFSYTCSGVPVPVT